MKRRKPSPKRAKARPKARAGRPGLVSGPRFVGREASPVMDRYPPKDPSTIVRGPPVASRHDPGPPTPPAAATASATAPPAAPNSAAPSPSAPISLIALEKPFDVDEFSQMLGETAIRVMVPREDLGEVLRRVADFMGFGIYVYRVTLRPAASDLLKQFVVELQRVDYSPSEREWVPFVEKGRSESPFGPGSTR